MRLPDRTFEDSDAVASDLPASIGITGFSASGKTWTALEIAFGAQSVLGGRVWVIDTDGGRAKHYAPYFKGADGNTFRHVPFSAPFGPLHFLKAIEHCYAHGARIILIDTMSAEHEGEGGVLDQVESFLESRTRNIQGEEAAQKRRDALKFAAQIEPKAQRRALNDRINQLTDVFWVFTYKAQEKIRPGTKNKDTGQPERGWAPISTSPLFWSLTLRILLPPGSDGHASWKPKDEKEQQLVKLPFQFRQWFKDGEQITRDHGRRLALWSREGLLLPPGGKPPAAELAPPPAATPAPAPAAAAPPPPEPPRPEPAKAPAFVPVIVAGTVRDVQQRNEGGRNWSVARIRVVPAADPEFVEVWTREAPIAEALRAASDVDGEFRIVCEKKDARTMGGSILLVREIQPVE